VKAKGKSKSVEMYECFDNDPAELLEHKIQSSSLFASAISEYRKGLFLSAGKLFARIAQLNANDTVAAYYRDRCTLSVLHERDPELAK
jgi:hypothetical protein